MYGNLFVNTIKRLKRIDWILLSIPIIITILGIMTIYSATRPVIDTFQPKFYLRQTVWLVLSLIMLLVVISFDYNRILRFTYHIYAFGILLLLLTIVSGHTGMGAQRWISLGPISFQPSEIFRIILILVTARFLATKGSPLRFSNLSMFFLLYGLVPFFLLYLQPDLGTALVLLVIVTLQTIVRGVHRKVIIGGIIITLIVLPFLGNVLWHGLKGYQKNRLMAFIDPGVDPRGIGYQIEQSKITIGSGKIFGKGYLKGTQGPFRFLPEKHTDFIFSVFAEEWGFFGSIILLLLYMILIIRGLETAYYAKDLFGTLIATGISIMFLLYLTINIGMTMGLMPVVGIPLPFFSYGGTALLSNFISVGLLINIRMRRFELFY
ncbi:Rod shape-determining protein RodA [bacterium BMS3Bbin06]|nr:Rod shape-determining protein RodA [bacterium BMS3Abin08]GBE35440.1 Rod shape-determining protein RodA [bacterium BMS3Bbin06]HDO35208.1 rod shape-determining protein RodA [Nitrospirota bacterium]HDY71443.1 rod shape-determining protein RodA [Nitrospirota bacterium]